MTRTLRLETLCAKWCPSGTGHDHHEPPPITEPPIVVQPDVPQLSPIGDSQISPTLGHDEPSKATDLTITDEQSTEPALETEPQTHANHGEVRSEQVRSTPAPISLDGLFQHLEHALAGAFAVARLDEAAHPTHSFGMNNNLIETHVVHKEHLSMHPASLSPVTPHSPSHQGAIGLVNFVQHAEETHVPADNDDQDISRMHPQHRPHELAADILRWEFTPNILVPSATETMREAVEAIDTDPLQFMAEQVQAFHIVGAETEPLQGRPLTWAAVSILLLWCSWTVQQPKRRKPTRYLAIQ